MTSNSRRWLIAELTDLAFRDNIEQRQLSKFRNSIIETDKIEDKAQRDRIMADIRSECISIHNTRIAIAVARQKVLRKMEDRRAYFKKISSIEEYQWEYQQVWTL